MSRKQYELNTTSQALEWYPPEGVPTAATVGIYIGSTSTLLAPVAVVLDTANQALGAHALGALTLTVASSAAFVVGRRYWLDDGYRGYEVEVYAIPAGGLTLVLTEGLRRALTAGTIKGHGLRRTLTAAETGVARRHLRVVWRYTIGTARVAEELVDVVLWPFAIPLTEDDLESADPSFGEQVGATGKWRQWVAGAVNAIWQALEGAALKPDKVMSRDALVLPAVYKACQIRHLRDPELFERYGKLYDEAWAACLASRETWYDDDEDLEPDSTDSDGEEGLVEIGVGSGVFIERTPTLSTGYQIGASRPGETSGFPAARKLKVM